MNNAVIKNIIVLAGFIPLLLQVPYMLKVWRSSRLDQWDWCFMVVALSVLALVSPKLRRESTSIDWKMASGVVVGMVMYATGVYWSVNAVCILGSMVLGWSFIGVGWGMAAAVRTCPILGILMLSCSSTSYWLSYFTTIDGLTIKIILTVILLILQLVIWKKGNSFSLQGVGFGLGIIVLGLIYIASGWEYEVWGPFNLSLERNFSGEFIGMKVEPTPSDRKFFGQSQVERAVYANKNNNISVLKVSEFDDVHQIHPAGHCLRTSGRNVILETLRTVVLPSGKLQVNEITVDDSNGYIMLLWAWYGNEYNSSGSFIFFRRKYQTEQKWSAWQIALTVRADQLESARKTLTEFLVEFYQPQ